MRPIPAFLIQTRGIILPFLKNFHMHQPRCICAQFRELHCEQADMQVMYYSSFGQIILVGIEQHHKEKDYLVDEEPFDDEPPLYFAENDHYVSPIYRLKQLRKAMMKALSDHSLPVPMMPWIVLVTNSELINKDDYDDDVWLPDHIMVFDKVRDMTMVEQIEEHFNGSDENKLVFERANEYTDCQPFVRQGETEEEEDKEDTVTNEEFEQMLKDFIDGNYGRDESDGSDENDGSDESDENDERDESDESDEENEEVKGPFSEDYEDTICPPHAPTLADGLRAKVYARFKKPGEALKKLIGCEEIKEQIEQLTILHQYNRRLVSNNPESEEHEVSMHAIFHGAPGTGKTTLCRLYASLLYKAGALSNGHVVVADRSTFVGNNFGDEEKAVWAVLEAAKGGVLMIDEAYQLNPPHPNDPGKNVLPLMMPQLADETDRDMAVVLCGYTEPMEKLLSQNEGLNSRFPNRFKFPDFTVPQLLQISKLRIKRHGYHFTPKAWELYREVVTRLYNNRDKRTWGNAREVANLLDKIYIHHANRCERLRVEKKKMLAITVADIKPVQNTDTPKKRGIGFK